MDPSMTLVNGQPVPKIVKELATEEDGGVNTAVVAFLHDGYVRGGAADPDRDTQIRPAPAVDHEADTVVTAPPEE